MPPLFKKMEKEQFIKGFIEQEFSFLSEERKITIYAIYKMGVYDRGKEMEDEIKSNKNEK